MSADAPVPPATAADRLLVALDVETLGEAEALLDRLRGVVTGCKVGSQLFTAAGPAAVELARKRDFRVFLDLKFHDIPNTVAGAVREATRLGVFMLTIHAGGGVAMMQAAAESARKAASDFKVPRPLTIAVTVLTSLDRRALEVEVGVPSTVERYVVHLADRARAAGLDGCVASPQETRLLRLAMGPRWIIVTPGVRPDRGATTEPAATTGDDQARIATPAAAVAAGSDYLVVGRPITQAPDPAVAARTILAEVGSGRPTSR